MSDDRPSLPIGVACAQLAPRIGEPDRNRADAAAAIAQAAALGARLIVLPELCTSGYSFEDAEEARVYAEPIDGPTLSSWSELAARYGTVIIGGFCELDGRGAVRNSAAVVDASGVHCVYRKTHLWDREQLIFTAGDAPAPVLDTAIGRIGVAVCYDAFFPEVMRSLALAGADLIAVPMNSPVLAPARGPLAIEVVLAIAAAHVNGVFVAQADRAGPERGIEWAQASVIVDPAGTVLAGPRTGPNVLVAECELAAARDKSLGGRNDVLADRRPELYAETEAGISKAKTKETVP
jgi:predicted amidohydrolase